MSIPKNAINRKKNKCNPARVRHTEICMSLLTILGEEKKALEEASSRLFSFSLTRAEYLISVYII